MGNNLGIGGLKRSFCCPDAPDMPMYFRVKVPRGGNYTIEMLMGDYDSETDITVFSERRRCVLRNAHAQKGEFIRFTFTANVCGIIPRGKETVYQDDGIDITVIGNSAHLNAVTVREDMNTPAVYIVGDSTVTDQPAEYPYAPGNSYCGWGQMLPAFLKSGIAVSNHAHSGLSTASLLNEGHWDVVMKEVKPKDYIFIQFGHNDQKDKNLAAFGGYTKNLERLVNETREKGAIPVIITPVSRSLWNAPGGSFNDLLKDWARACCLVAQKTDTPLVDLHAASMYFILDKGKEEAKQFFYPGDFTHFNDYGGYVMASFVVEGIRKTNLKKLQKYLRDIDVQKIEILPDYNLPKRKAAKVPFVKSILEDMPIPVFKDIDGLAKKADIQEIVRRGIMSGKEGTFRPAEPVSRAEFLSSLFAAFHYLPKNVYNDVYTDIFGDEWYAGTVQSAYDSGFIDKSLTPDGEFKPNSYISCGEALSITIHVINDICGNKAAIDAANMADPQKKSIEKAEPFNININVPWKNGTVLNRAQVASLIKQSMDETQKLCDEHV